MILVDKALEARAAAGNPVRVGLVGAGFMGRGITNQIVNSVAGMRLVAVANRHVEGAQRAYLEAGVPEGDTVRVETVAELERALAGGRFAVTEDAGLLCKADGVDAVIEATGTVEYGANVVLRAMENGKHVLLMNAELDGTLGPVLRTYADRAGVIYSATEGDQPGVQMNLFRFVRGLGLRPLLCGNIKGLHDPYRNPTTQEGFAKKWGQKPQMVTSFADGTKISFEQATVANATGFTIAQRAMLGYDFAGHVDDATVLFDVDQLTEMGGIVDYLVGSRPGPGVFVYATHDDPKQRHYLNLFKLGEGPLYSLYTPYHLCHFEVPNSVARAVLFHDAVMAPLAGPLVDVVAAAKVDLRAGQCIDGMGGYMTYGLCERSGRTRELGLLPIGLAEGCRLVRNVAKDGVLTYGDVEVPAERLSDRLRAEQETRFSPQAGAGAAVS